MKSIVSGSLLALVAIAAQSALASGTTLLYLDYDDVKTYSVKEGADLLPYVCDGEYNAARSGANAGFLRMPSGVQRWEAFSSSVATAIKEANKELTIEFFIKGNPDSLAAWHYLLTVGGPWSGQWGVIVDANASKNLRLRVCAGGIYEKSTSVSLVDGKWHHVAIVITPINDGAASHIDSYVDYKQVHDQDASGVYLYSSGGSLDVNHNGTSACGGCDVDEVRFTRGALTVDEFLRFDDTMPPADGATLLYLPFDTDAKTIAYTNKQGTVNGITDLTAATRTHTAVKEFGTDVKIRAENKSFLQQSTAHDLYVYNSFYALKKEQCQTCTIEFFIRGSSSVVNWETPFCYGTWTSLGNYGLLLQVDNSKNIWMKPGVGSADIGFQVPVDLSKEKWHHVAVEIQPSTKAGCEGGSHFEVFVDYAETPVVKKDYANAFNGLSEGRMVFNPAASHCAFDELRVTKGLLPVSKFLSFEKLGLILVVK